MSISEKQFQQMLKGTVHEGRYEKESPATMDTQAPARPAPKRNPRSEAEHLAGIANRVLPWAVGFRVLFTLPSWFAITIIIGIAAPSVFGLFYGISWLLFQAFTIASESPLFFVLFLVNIVLIVAGAIWVTRV